MFSIEYPASALIRERPPRDSVREVSVSELPECRWPCYVTISIWRDTSAFALDTAVRQETMPDTTDNPDAADYAASIRDSLPLGNARAFHLETSCGDCTSGALLTTHGPWIARIEYSLDDRDGNDEALLAHLVTVARTFRWIGD